MDQPRTRHGKDDRAVRVQCLGDADDGAPEAVVGVASRFEKILLSIDRDDDELWRGRNRKGGGVVLEKFVSRGERKTFMEERVFFPSR